MTTVLLWTLLVMGWLTVGIIVVLPIYYLMFTRGNQRIDDDDNEALTLGSAIVLWPMVVCLLLVTAIIMFVFGIGQTLRITSNKLDEPRRRRIQEREVAEIAAASKYAASLRNIHQLQDELLPGEPWSLEIEEERRKQVVLAKRAKVVRGQHTVRSDGWCYDCRTYHQREAWR